MNRDGHTGDEASQTITPEPPNGTQLVVANEWGTWVVVRDDSLASTWGLNPELSEAGALYRWFHCWDEDQYPITFKEILETLEPRRIGEPLNRKQM